MAAGALDALAAERRRLPMVAFDRDYRFTRPDGTPRLPDLFEDRRQLIVYLCRLVGSSGPPAWHLCLMRARRSGRMSEPASTGAATPRWSCPPHRIASASPR
ncbi:MAG: hypothetical protein AVDCRST_MAG88-3760 [uncultured Thermomicrobiales bacterium]|uniref:Uncharacterized protein n=1 Tax=uncultured Thermomicrobiales bacterium TaxID=1645740 RepID=A0A6J4VQ50_9BACT|nr:MAG: hypothetical protein AVDCRST_MAG88-3760 [uncultured Thermomicrobiales bacterium]